MGSSSPPRAESASSSAPDTQLGAGAWAVVLASLPARAALARLTDLTPDEAYYLAAARLGRAPADHPPLLPWLLGHADRLAGCPLELRARLVPLATGALTALAVAATVRATGGSRRAGTLGALFATWLLLPAAGGFVATPDGPALLAVAVAALALVRPTGPRVAFAGLALAAGALAKVALLPVALLLAAGLRARPAHRLAVALPALATTPWLVPSLAFQLPHAYAAHAPGLLDRAGAPLAAVAAAVALFSPVVVLPGLRRLGALPAPLAWVAAGMGALVLASALVRGVPPEPNWWAPAALPVLVAAAGAWDGWTSRRRAWAGLVAFAPTALAVSHAARPWLPFPPHADPTARLHRGADGARDLAAVGTGRYAAAADACVYRNECVAMTRFLDHIDANPSCEFSGSLDH